VTTWEESEEQQTSERRARKDVGGKQNEEKCEGVREE
jgi:hypothetical protein